MSNSETNTANARLSSTEIYMGLLGSVAGAATWAINSTTVSVPKTNYYADDIGELKSEINALLSFNEEAIILPDKLQAKVDNFTQKEVVKDSRELKRLEALAPDAPSIWVKPEGIAAMGLIGVIAFVGTTYTIRNIRHHRARKAEMQRLKEEREKSLNEQTEGAAANLEDELNRFLNSRQEDQDN